jgi:hypothetical protein
MKTIFFFCLSLACSFLSAAEVLKISKNKMNMAVSSDLGTSWEVGQKVCVQSKQGKSFCGTIIKVREEGAICKMNAPLVGVAVGDAVGDASTPDGGTSLGESSGEGLSESKPSLKSSSKSEMKKSKPGIGFGIKGGLALSKFSSDKTTYDNATNRKGLDLGIILDLPTSQTGDVSFEAGLNFLQAGVELQNSSLHGDFIEFTALLKTKFIHGDVSPIAFVGSYLTYMLSMKYVDAGGELDYKKYYNTIDYGAVGGLGMSFKMAPDVEAGLTGSYVLGLTNINDSKQSFLTETDKNRRLQFLLHLIFRG